jgi:hypothetical protein
MARKVSKETVQLWRERMARQAASGVSIRQFCDQEADSSSHVLRVAAATPSSCGHARETR